MAAKGNKSNSNFVKSNPSQYIEKLTETNFFPFQVTSKAGYYREGREFTKTKDVLGKGNSAGDIIVIKDKTTHTESAHKTVRYLDSVNLKI